MASFSDDEALQMRIEKLGENFGPLFHHVENDLRSLRVLWRVYVAFFGFSPKRVDLLNSSSGITAVIIERTFFESALLSLCRLTDPPTGNRGASLNTTVTRFPSFLEDHKKIGDLRSLVDHAVNQTAFARSWRNKRVAHSDYDVRQKKARVDRASRKQMSDATDAISAVVRWVGLECLDTTIVTHPISEFTGDEVSFLKHLYLGVGKERQLEAERRQLAQEGKYAEAEDKVSNFPDWLGSVDN